MRSCFRFRLSICLFLLAGVVGDSSHFAAAADLRVLFLGDQGHHAPRARFGQLEGVLAARGIRLSYSEAVTDLNAQTLGKFAALVLYANIDTIGDDQATALLKYVQQGGGFVPIHCASFCFRNSPEVVALMGAQFLRHGSGVFRTEIAEPDHPLLRGFGGFESWDETYVHHLHNPAGRVVLEYRVDDQGREPWTWVRTQGKGRVFYTAWGHDARTWGNAGFQNLIERGIRWASGGDPADAGPYVAELLFPVPEMTPPRDDVAPLEYVDVDEQIPNYLPSEKWGVQGEPHRQMQKPLVPDESQKHFVVPRGFRVERFVAEPQLQGKPIAMNWDERGRLFVCETIDYPNEMAPRGEGRDRIRLCIDRDRDGRADEFRVFAEGLSVPTTLLAFAGGWIVQNGSQTLFLKDRDGDDRADDRQVLIDGWSVSDTHAGVSNFRYGPDNWIWGVQGYNPSEPVIEGRNQQPFRMGFFRFRVEASDRPRVTQLEFVRSTDNNTWGLGFSEEGLVFGSTANHNPSVFLPLANRYYERVRGWNKTGALPTIADTFKFRPITDKVRQVDQFGGYTAGAGHALYTARRYPREYWNRTAFVCDPTGHLAGTFVLSPQGSTFRAVNSFNLLASDDQWSGPIAAEVGPDGNVWVIDWYNYIVQHNPTPQGFKTGKGAAYETSLRDKTHGRIYRVVFDTPDNSHALDAFPKLDRAEPAGLVAALAHSNMFWRLQAQRLLVERGQADVVPALVRLAENASNDAIGLNPSAMHALWTLAGLGQFDGNHAEASAAALAALAHSSAGVRRTAVGVLPPIAESAMAIVKHDLLRDRDAQVRLAAFLRLSELEPTSGVGRALVDAMLDPRNADDPWLADAATCAAAQNAESFLVALAGQGSVPRGMLAIATIVAGHQARQSPGEKVLALARKLVDADAQVASAVIEGWAAGWPENAPLPSTTAVEPLLDALLPRLDLAGRGRLIRLAERWGSPAAEKHLAAVRESLLTEVDNAAAPIASRAEAARQLVALSPENGSFADELLSRVNAQASPELAGSLLRALEVCEAPELGERVLARFGELTPAARAAAVAVLLARAPSTLAMLDAAKRREFSLGELSLDQRQALLAHPDRRIQGKARTLLALEGVLANPDRQKVIEELRALAEATGSAAAGREAFKKHCAKCHRHSGEGAAVGPELTGMAVHSKLELLTQILDPSRSVEGNFQTYSLSTADGRVLTGIVTAETQTTLELLDAEAKRHALLRAEIDQLARSTKSLMPEGFEKQATAEELRDLLEFLTARGRFLPMDLSKAATVSSVRGMFIDTANEVERLVFDDWEPRTFEGVPFHLIDPRGGTVRNAIVLQSPHGPVAAGLPRSAVLACRGAWGKIHLLSGVSGWGYPASTGKTVSLVVRLHYADGAVEDHPLRNEEHFADYIRQVDVPGSKLAWLLDGRQIRYLAIEPLRAHEIRQIEFLKGDDLTAPVVMAVTLEAREAEAAAPQAAAESSGDAAK